LVLYLTNNKFNNYKINLDYLKLINLIEEMQLMRKRTIEFLSDINNFVLKDLVSKFKGEKRVHQF